MRAGIGLGANLGDRLRCLTIARARISTLPKTEPPLLSSALYETEPIDCEAGAPKFLNAVIEIGYSGSSKELIAELKKIEIDLGRPPGHERNRSRPIDLDLLYHGAHIEERPELQLPHPRLHLRGFVLHPLAEIRPNLILPGQRKTVREMAEELLPAPLMVRTGKQW